MRRTEILDLINGGNFEQKGRETKEAPLSWIGCGFEVELDVDLRLNWRDFSFETKLVRL